FFFQAEDGIRDFHVTGVQTCALPISLIEAKVARLTPHSSDDDDRVYKSREAVAEEKAKDCVLRFRRTLEERAVLNPGDAEEVRAECMREVDRAQEDAESAPLPSPESLHLHVYGDE